MKVLPQQLAANITKQRAPCYLLFGDEPLLKMDALELIGHASKKEGFDEVHRFDISTGFNWQSVYQLCQNLSLFSSKIRIELTIMPNNVGGIKKEITEGLVKLAELLHSDLLLVVIGDKIASNQEKSSWFLALKGQHGVFVVCNTPPFEQLPQFIAYRCQQMKLTVDQPSLQLLAQLHEGNLLALVQSLHLLHLIYPDGHLNLLKIETILSQQSHFTPFQLIDALLIGKIARGQRILKQLENEAEEPIIILRVIQKEMLTLFKIKQQQLNQENSSMAQLLSKNGVWSQKQSQFTQAMQRLTLEHLNLIIAQMNRLEIGLKTEASLNAWHELSYLCFMISGSAD